MNISMPKACISCAHYEPTGWAEDEMCMYQPGPFEAAKTRTQIGKCSAHNKQAFCTEICSSYQKDDFIDVVEVKNRPALVPHQEVLI